MHLTLIGLSLHPLQRSTALLYPSTKELIKLSRSARLVRRPKTGMADSSVVEPSLLKGLSFVALCSFGEDYMIRQPPLRLLGHTGLGHCPSRISIRTNNIPPTHETSGG